MALNFIIYHFTNSLQDDDRYQYSESEISRLDKMNDFYKAKEVDIDYKPNLVSWNVS